MRLFKRAFMVAVLGACLPVAHADDIPWGLNPNLNDKIFFGLGAFYGAKTSTTAQLSSQTLGVGTSVDFQNMLGLSDSAGGPDAEFRWRMSERWRLELNYFRISHKRQQDHRPGHPVGRCRLPGQRAGDLEDCFLRSTQLGRILLLQDQR